MKRLLLTLLLIPFIYGCSERVALDNGKMRLEFDREAATLLSMVDLETGYQYLDTEAEPQRLWSIVPLKAEDVIAEPAKAKVRKISRHEVKLVWYGEGALTLEARVRLDKEKPLSYWSVEMKDYDKAKVKELVFPYLTNIKAFTNEELLIPDWTGALYKNPRAEHKRISLFKRNHQHHSMQLSAIYGDEESGIYIATNDAEGYGKSFTVEFRDALTNYQMINILDVESDQDSYKPSYDFVLGTLHGNWYDAALIYREWALQQAWVKNNRLHSGKMNSWLPETDVWMWNRGHSSNVLPEAEDLKKYLGDCNVSVLWHWWHNGPYDDAFPEYIPPREGRESFVEAVAKARSKGINMTPYMNSFQWGGATKSFREKGVERYVARKADGSTLAHIYNKFTENPLVPVCITQEFWRETYSGLCDTLINGYGCSGVYMDQSCNNYLCYNADHGHTVGGGNYWVKSHQRLIERIREKTTEQNPVLTGEGSGEDWIAHLDGFLTLEGSRERMRGAKASDIVPLFNAVYHGYAICFGNLSGLTYPPYDDCWPKKYRSPDTETLLPEKYRQQMRMEQARTFVWGTQPMISNYHPFVRKGRPVEMRYFAELVAKRKQYKGYLQYGIMMRAPKMENEYAKEVDMVQMTIYSYKTEGTNIFPFKKRVPTLYSSAWRNNEGNILLAFTNINEETKALSFTIDLNEMGLNDRYTLYIDGVAQEGAPQSHYNVTIDGCSAKMFEFRNNK
ncbi:MAG: hypothetical protein IIV24_06635 [Alistipes sp.]|nr:hypothetical protein [Alistipes sp.]